MPMRATANGQQGTKDEIIHACWQSPNISRPIESEVANQRTTIFNWYARPRTEE